MDSIRIAERHKMSVYNSCLERESVRVKDSSSIDEEFILLVEDEEERERKTPCTLCRSLSMLIEIKMCEHDQRSV